MGKLSKKDVKYVARLAKLELTSGEIDKFKGQLSKVIDYVSELEEVDTSNVEPTSQTTGLSNVVREDRIDANQSLSVEDTVSGSEKIHNNYFVVQPLLNKD